MRCVAPASQSLFVPALKWRGVARWPVMRIVLSLMSREAEPSIIQTGGSYRLKPRELLEFREET